ncbi:MAG: DUF2249 domain-containing protein [Natronomonas sp.]
MRRETAYRSRSDAPGDRPTETLDARELPPPKPLKRTLETLAEADDAVVLIQLNDRHPQHLYPQLEDRGYQYESFEDDAVVTVIWKN